MKHAFGMLSLYVRDIPKAQAFYAEFLGMNVVSALSGPSFVFLQPVEGTPIALQDASMRPKEISGQPGGFEVNLEVEDVDAAWQEWKAKGVEGLTDITDMGAGRTFRARDTEGHVLSVYQLYPQVKAMRPQ
jgi:predicted enzyme related to lactoylglutathione lyase